MSMARLRLKWDTAWQFSDQHGCSFSFLTTSPKAIAGMVRTAYREKLEKTITDKFELPRPVNMEPARCVLKNGTLSQL